MELWIEGQHPRLERCDVGLAAEAPPLWRLALTGGASPGFRVVANLGALPRNNDVLLALVPMVRDRPGYPMFSVLSPSLPLPPEEYQTGIGGHFESVALQFLAHCIYDAGLSPSARVLDAGCGVGRMAFGLCSYLDAAATYDGFDVVQKWILWAQRNISSRLPTFRFAHADVFNLHYNPQGAVAPDAWAFPYADGAFDFALLTSVFTHMRSREVRHYLSELRRVLAPGARCLCTWFLLNDETQRLLGTGEGLQIVHPLGDCFTSNPDLPEYAIGFRDDDVMSWIHEAGFTVQRKLYGSWPKRRRFVSFQDSLVIQRQP